MSENDTRDPGVQATTNTPLERESVSEESPGPEESPDTPSAEESPLSESDHDQHDSERLEARLALLREEHDRLRREYVRARQSQYRRTALWLGLLGALAVGAGVLVPEQSTILLALGGTGLFSAVLTHYLTPEQFVPATVGERIHQAHSANQAALIDELGVQDDRLYVPTPEASTPARLFVPQRADYDVPPTAALAQLLVVTDEPETRGIAFRPTGAPLYQEFEATVTGTPATDAGRLAAQLSDAIVETFELADSATADPDRDGDVVAVRVTDPVYGRLDDPDHPIVSVLATGLAAGLETTVSVDVREGDDDAGLVVCELAD